MNTETTYSIAYAYPTSDTAHLLNNGEGCWYVKCETHREDGSWYTAPVIDAFPAASEDDAYLVEHLADWREDTGPARTLAAHNAWAAAYERGN